MASRLEQVRDHLLNTVGDSEYIKSKHIAESLGLRSKEVAACLRKIDRFDDRITLEKWGKSRGCVTWRVELNQ